jgi:hypothetical protein
VPANLARLLGDRNVSSITIRVYGDLAADK